jgi:hypothetical protein
MNSERGHAALDMHADTHWVAALAAIRQGKRPPVERGGARLQPGGAVCQARVSARALLGGGRRLAAGARVRPTIVHLHLAPCGGRHRSLSHWACSLTQGAHFERGRTRVGGGAGVRGGCARGAARRPGRLRAPVHKKTTPLLFLSPLPTPFLPHLQAAGARKRHRLQLGVHHAQRGHLHEQRVHKLCQQRQRLL